MSDTDDRSSSRPDPELQAHARIKELKGELEKRKAKQMEVQKHNNDLLEKVKKLELQVATLTSKTLEFKKDNLKKLTERGKKELTSFPSVDSSLGGAAAEVLLKSLYLHYKSKCVLLWSFPRSN